MFKLHDVKYCWRCHNFLNTKHMQVRRVWVWARERHSWEILRFLFFVKWGIPVWWMEVNEEGQKMDEKGEAEDSRCKYRASAHWAGVIMADVFLQMSLFQPRLTHSTRTQRLIESSGLDRLSLGCAGNGCLWPITQRHPKTHWLKHCMQNTPGSCQWLGNMLHL